MEVYGTKRTGIQEVVNLSPLNLDSYLMMKNAGTWRESDSDAVFCIDDMRNWLERMKTPNEHMSFTMDMLPTFDEHPHFHQVMKVCDKPREADG